MLVISLFRSCYSEQVVLEQFTGAQHAQNLLYLRGTVSYLVSCHCALKSTLPLCQVRVAMACRV